MSTAGGAVCDWDTRPRQGVELIEQQRLILLYGEYERVLLGDQPVGVRALGVQRIGGDHHPVEVQVFKHSAEDHVIAAVGLIALVVQEMEVLVVD